MAYRVIQWGSGNVGRHALRAIIERPDLELVGLKVYSDSKVGMDAGDITGQPKTGILATTSIDEILALKADCVSYTPLGMTKGEIDSSIDEICMLLRNGFNVVSSAVEAAIYPKALPADVLSRLEEACARGNSSFLTAGINPGFTMDIWPIFMTRNSRRIDRVYCLESCDMKAYTSKMNMASMGFGKTPEELGPANTRVVGPDYETNAFYASVLMVADALNIPLEATRFEQEYGFTDVPFEVASGTIEAGTAAVVKWRYVGEAFGRDVLVNEWIWRVSDDIKPEWGVGEFWSMTVDGDPGMHCRIDAHTDFDSKRIVSLTVATNVVNCIPAVCDASPGPKSALDLPLSGGGLVTR